MKEAISSPFAPHHHSEKDDFQRFTNPKTTETYNPYDPDPYENHDFSGGQRHTDDDRPGPGAVVHARPGAARSFKHYPTH